MYRHRATEEAKKLAIGRALTQLVVLLTQGGSEFYIYLEYF